jgi:hypothetical protein
VVAALIIGECTTVLVCVQAARIALIEQQSLGSTSAHMTEVDAAGTELGEVPRLRSCTHSHCTAAEAFVFCVSVPLQADNR